MSLPTLRRPEKAGTEMSTTVMSAQTTGKSTEMALQTTTDNKINDQFKRCFILNNNLCCKAYLHTNPVKDVINSTGYIINYVEDIHYSNRVIIKSTTE